MQIHSAHSYEDFVQEYVKSEKYSKHKLKGGSSIMLAVGVIGVILIIISFTKILSSPVINHVICIVGTIMASVLLVFFFKLYHFFLSRESTTGSSLL